MGLLEFLNDILSDDNDNKDDKLFLEECEIFGMTKEEIEDCKKCGLTPEEWMEANEREYYREL